MSLSARLRIADIEDWKRRYRAETGQMPNAMRIDDDTLHLLVDDLKAAGMFPRGVTSKQANEIFGMRVLPARPGQTTNVIELINIDLPEPEPAGIIAGRR